MSKSQDTKKAPMSKLQDNNEATNPKIYNLDDRTALFGKGIIAFARLLPTSAILDPLIKQIVRSGTSVGANFVEADGAITKKDFTYKISLCRKEAKETRYWLQMINIATDSSAIDIAKLSQEAKELTLIFSSIIKN